MQASPLGTIMGSEDCLYLNIWVPHGQQGRLPSILNVFTYVTFTLMQIIKTLEGFFFYVSCLSVSSNLPVMVWIYGGGFMSGDTLGSNLLGNYLYSGQEMADRGNIIFVSVAYRVGALGFLSTGDSTLPGNGSFHLSNVHLLMSCPYSQNPLHPMMGIKHCCM